MTEFTREFVFDWKQPCGPNASDAVQPDDSWLSKAREELLGYGAEPSTERVTSRYSIGSDEVLFSMSMLAV